MCRDFNKTSVLKTRIWGFQEDVCYGSCLLQYVATNHLKILVARREAQTVPCWWPTNIWCHSTKFSRRPCDLCVCVYVWTFQKSLLPPWKFQLADGDDRLLWNIGIHIPDYMTSHIVWQTIRFKGARIYVVSNDCVMPSKCSVQCYSAKWVGCVKTQIFTSWNNLLGRKGPCLGLHFPVYLQLAFGSIGQSVLSDHSFPLLDFSLSHTHTHTHTHTQLNKSPKQWCRTVQTTLLSTHNAQM